MNLLRQKNLCNALKSYHHLNFISISLPSVSLHSDCTNRRIQVIETCAKTKPYNYLSQSLRNTKQLDVSQRLLSSNHHHVIGPKNGLLSDLKSNIDPYKRLVRLDRPIGMQIIFLTFLALSRF